MSDWPELVRYASLVPLEDAGHPPASLADVVDGLVPRAQREIGRRWENNELTVAEEHVATQAAASLLRSSALMFPSPSRSTLKVLVTCADGEWHRLAAEAVATLLSGSGVRTSMAPASTHAAQLASLVHDDGYHAVAVSCSMEANLPGARKMIAAALDTGTPVIAGGAAFGFDDTRARLLGATAWAPTATAAASLIETLRLESLEPPLLDHEAEVDYSVLENSRSDVANCLAERLVDGSPGDHLLVNAAAWMFRSLVAALLCNDAEILHHQAAWQRRRADVASEPSPRRILSTLADCLSEEAKLAQEWVANSLEASVGAEPAAE